mgnify:CR=1 FL=1
MTSSTVPTPLQAVYRIAFTKGWRWLLLAPLLCVVLNPAQAQQRDKPFETFDDYNVFFSVFNSTFIKPEIARHYNLSRGKDRALINIAITRTHNGRQSLGLRALVKGSATNLMQQQKSLEFVEIQEQDTIYYLAPLRFTNEEVMNFAIQVQPAANQPPYTLTFTKTLYVEN